MSRLFSGNRFLNPLPISESKSKYLPYDDCEARTIEDVIVAAQSILKNFSLKWHVTITHESVARYYVHNANLRRDGGNLYMF